MNPRVRAVEPFGDYKLRINFTNDEVGVYDCSPLLGFGVFRKFRDKRCFQLAKAADGTVVWPNGQDICPDTLYEDRHKVAAHGTTTSSTPNTK